jgi:hypothetical protein
VPRHNYHARPVRRGRHITPALPAANTDEPCTYMRWCPDCGNVTESDDARHFYGWVECPVCTIANGLRPTATPLSVA